MRAHGSLPASGAQPRRRDFTRQCLAGGIAALAGPAEVGPAAAPPRTRYTLGFSTYAMPAMRTEVALDALARLGYDSVELCVLAGRDCAPERLDASRRKALRRRLADRRLLLTSLMEQLTPSPEPASDQTTRERLRRAVELAHELAPGRPPLIETVLGGGTWERTRALFRDRVGGWGEVAGPAGVVLAVKPHRFGAMNHPDQARWLLEQLKWPAWLRLAYDYSHFDLRGLPLERTVADLAPHAAFVAVKDVVLRDGKAQFVLPGESGSIDYVRLFTLLDRAGYRGDINCEVSGMVQARPGYDPVAAARACHAPMARALAAGALRGA